MESPENMLRLISYVPSYHKAKIKYGKFYGILNIGIFGKLWKDFV